MSKGGTLRYTAWCWAALIEVVVIVYTISRIADLREPFTKVICVVSVALVWGGTWLWVRSRLTDDYIKRLEKRH